MVEKETDTIQDSSWIFNSSIQVHFSSTISIWSSQRLSSSLLLALRAMPQPISTSWQDHALSPLAGVAVLKTTPLPVLPITTTANAWWTEIVLAMSLMDKRQNTAFTILDPIISNLTACAAWEIWTFICRAMVHGCSTLLEETAPCKASAGRAITASRTAMNSVLPAVWATSWCAIHTFANHERDEGYSFGMRSIIWWAVLAICKCSRWRTSAAMVQLEWFNWSKMSLLDNCINCCLLDLCGTYDYENSWKWYNAVRKTVCQFDIKACCSRDV